MAFWGLALKPGASKSVESPEGDIMHLSQACLVEPKEGKNHLMAKVKGVQYAIACLEKGKKEHDSFDLFFNSTECVFMNKGQSEVHLTGYFEPEGLVSGDEDEESEEAPAASKSPKAAAKVASPKVVAAAKAAAAAEDDDSDEDEEEEEGSMLEDEEEESEEVLQKPNAAGKVSPKAAASAKAAPDDDDESDDDDEDEEEESEEPPMSPGKRAALASVAASPAKKAKGSPEEAGKAAYVKLLADYLKKYGKTNLGVLGTKVQRPADAPKMKLRAIFEEHKDKFNLTGDIVEAK